MKSGNTLSDVVNVPTGRSIAEFDWPRVFAGGNASEPCAFAYWDCRENLRKLNEALLRQGKFLIHLTSM